MAQHAQDAERGKLLGSELTASRRGLQSGGHPCRRDPCRRLRSLCYSLTQTSGPGRILGRMPTLASHEPPLLSAQRETYLRWFHNAFQDFTQSRKSLLCSDSVAEDRISVKKKAGGVTCSCLGPCVTDQLAQAKLGLSRKIPGPRKAQASRTCATKYVSHRPQRLQCSLAG